MHTFALLPLLAGLSAAWVYPAQYESSATRLGQRLLRRAVGDWKAPAGNAPSNSFTVYACPDGSDDYIKHGTLNTKDLGNAQDQLLQDCKDNPTVAPSSGGDGRQKTVGGVTVQFCNMNSSNTQCYPDVLSDMIDQIWCGQDRTQPTEGYGQLKYKDQTSPEPTYVFYGPSDHKDKCKTTDQYNDIATQPQKCDNAAFQGRCGDQGGTQTSNSIIS